MNRDSVKIYPLGDTAIEVKFGEVIAIDFHHKILNLIDLIREHGPLVNVECVPGFSTLTIYYDPMEFTLEDMNPYLSMKTILESLLEKMHEQTAHVGRIIEIPVQYGDQAGPDLDFVASHTGLTTDQVVSLHSDATYTVYLLGFTPGFPYLGGMDSRLHTPRKSTPGIIIPEGSVGIGGGQTGVYPCNSPGGWQIIGKTEVKLFDPGSTFPCLLKPGDRVRFVPVHL